MQYARPAELKDALKLLTNGDWDILAGGTDFYPALGEDKPKNDILDITAIDSLRGVTEKVDHWRIGPLTTWTDIAALDLPTCFDALKQAAIEVGSKQIQNQATIAGNICNASPAADGVPALLILDAEIELTGATVTRQMPLSEFIAGNRQTELANDELLTAIIIPRMSATGTSAFHKLGSRRYLVISIVMSAVRLLKGPLGEVMTASVSVGACSAVAQRIPALEQALIAQPFDQGLADLISADQFTHLTPIDDIRAPASYRSWAMQESVRRAIRSCVEAA
jgi:CO/xanthine dehydrogenase FAD-binding subunit